MFQPLQGPLPGIICVFVPTLYLFPDLIFCFPTLMDPGPRDPKRPGPKAGPGPRESLLVCWATDWPKAQGSVGRVPYVGVYSPETDGCGRNLGDAATVPWPRLALGDTSETHGTLSPKTHAFLAKKVAKAALQKEGTTHAFPPMEGWKSCLTEGGWH